MSLTTLHRGVTRLTPARDGRRQIVVTIGPGDLISFRLSRGRKTFESTLSACYSMAVKATVAAERATRKRARRP
jgi:hypothetical protein